MKQKIGVVHPGMMGICVASTIQNSGHEVYWAAEGRSPQSRQRAGKFNLSDTGSLTAMCEICSVIVSVCPPHAAEETAEQVLRHSFRGVYLDVNAIAPQRTVRIGQAMTAAEVDFIDGGIIGPPVWDHGQTWLYLSGEFHVSGGDDLSTNCRIQGCSGDTRFGRSARKVGSLLIELKAIGSYLSLKRTERSDINKS